MEGAGERVDAFISHAGADRSWAESVDVHLRSLGWTTICDVYDVRPGDVIAMMAMP